MASEREDERLLKCLSNPSQKPGRIRAVDDAMIVRERQREHQARLELGSVPYRFMAAAGDAEDRDLRPVDDRAEADAADSSEIRNRDDTARHLVERELAGARLLGNLRKLRGKLDYALLLDVADDRDQEAAIGVHGHTDVGVLLVD